MRYTDTTLLSQMYSLSRLRLYERDCRRQAKVEPVAEYRADLSKLADAIQRRVSELETILCEQSEGRNLALEGSSYFDAAPW
jgi:hypothetical protein